MAAKKKNPRTKHTRETSLVLGRRTRMMGWGRMVGWASGGGERSARGRGRRRQSSRHRTGASVCRRRPRYEIRERSRLPPSRRIRRTGASARKPRHGPSPVLVCLKASSLVTYRRLVLGLRRGGPEEYARAAGPGPNKKAAALFDLSRSRSRDRCRMPYGKPRRVRRVPPSAHHAGRKLRGRRWASTTRRGQDRASPKGGSKEGSAPRNFEATQRFPGPKGSHRRPGADSGPQGETLVWSSAIWVNLTPRQ